MDKLEAEIQAKLKEAEALRRKAEATHARAEQAELEARILRRAAELRPNAREEEEEEGPDESDIFGVFDEAASPIQRRGRQPGSISRKWREILSDLAGTGKAFTIEGLIAAAGRRSLGIEERTARERIRRYIEQHFVQEVSHGLYVVTDEAIQRFGL